MNTELMRAVLSPVMKPIYANTGAQPLAGKPEDLAAFLTAEALRLGRLVERLRARVE